MNKIQQNKPIKLQSILTKAKCADLNFETNSYTTFKEEASKNSKIVVLELVLYLFFFFFFKFGLLKLDFHK